MKQKLPRKFGSFTENPYICTELKKNRRFYGNLINKGDYVMNIEEKKADFMRRFKASRERKAEYIAQMEKRMRDDYRRRTGKEAESFCVL